MRCGAFGSWHWGQRPVVAARSASWVRRLAVRVFECRRFGFGMISFDRLCARNAARQDSFFIRDFSGASRGSSQAGAQSHAPAFRFVPHWLHSPRQSSRHSGFIGSAR